MTLRDFLNGETLTLADFKQIVDMLGLEFNSALLANSENGIAPRDKQEQLRVSCILLAAIQQYGMDFEIVEDGYGT